MQTQLLDKDWQVGNIKCNVFAVTTDSLGTSAQAKSAIVVRPYTSTLSTVASTLQSSLFTGSVLQEPLKASQIVYAVVSIVNTVDCTGAGNCASIQRAACSTTPNTCGLCLPGYASPYVISNRPCRSTSTVSQLSPVGDKCSQSSQCISNTCQAGQCMGVPKVCLRYCNGHGSCVDVTTASSDIFDETCSADDPRCLAECVCKNGYYIQDLEILPLL